MNFFRSSEQKRPKTSPNSRLMTKRYRNLPKIVPTVAMFMLGVSPRRCSAHTN